MTSSAVDGSSQINSAGSLASAIASTTRWRWPPESWCGYARASAAGSGSRTWASSSTAASGRPLVARVPWIVIASATWAPTRIDGFSAVIGSWNTIATCAPAHVGALALGRAEQLDATPASRTAPRGRQPVGQQAEDAERGQRLARPGLADQPDPLAPADRQIDAVDERGRRRPGP